jgi:hypothetical protein
VGEGGGHQGFTINLLGLRTRQPLERSLLDVGERDHVRPAASLEEAYGVSPEELFEVYPKPLSGAILGGSYRRCSGCFLAVVDCVAVSHIR